MKQIFTILFILMCQFAYGQTYSKGDRQGYFDSNFGVAWLDDHYAIESVFPGCSFLGGRRTFINERHFVEMEAGVTAMNVFSELQGVRERQPLTEQFSGTWSIGYAFDRAGLSIDYTGYVYSPMKPRIPWFGPYTYAGSNTNSPGGVFCSKGSWVFPMYDTPGGRWSQGVQFKRFLAPA